MARIKDVSLRCWKQFTPHPRKLYREARERSEMRSIFLLYATATHAHLYTKRPQHRGVPRHGSRAQPTFDPHRDTFAPTPAPPPIHLPWPRFLRSRNLKSVLDGVCRQSRHGLRRAWRRALAPSRCGPPPERGPPPHRARAELVHLDRTVDHPHEPPG